MPKKTKLVVAPISKQEKVKFEDRPDFNRNLVDGILDVGWNELLGFGRDGQDQDPKVREKSPINWARWDHDAWVVLFVFGILSILPIGVPVGFLTNLGMGVGAAIVAFGCFFSFLWYPRLERVPQEHTYILMRQDRFAGFLLPGWRWLAPYLERIHEEGKVSFQVELWDVTDPIHAITHDGVKLPINIAFRFLVSALKKGLDYWKQAAYQYVFGFKTNQNFRDSLMTASEGRIRAFAAENKERTWEKVQSCRDEISDEVTEGVSHMFGDTYGEITGVELRGVDVQEIEVPEAILKAKEKLETAKLEAKAREQQGQGEGDFTLKRVQGFISSVDQLAKDLAEGGEVTPEHRRAATSTTLNLLGIDNVGKLADSNNKAFLDMKLFPMTPIDLSGAEQKAPKEEKPKGEKREEK